MLAASWLVSSSPRLRHVRRFDYKYAGEGGYKLHTEVVSTAFQLGTSRHLGGPEAERRRRGGSRHTLMLFLVTYICSPRAPSLSWQMWWLDQTLTNSRAVVCVGAEPEQLRHLLPQEAEHGKPKELQAAIPQKAADLRGRRMGRTCATF